MAPFLRMLIRNGLAIVIALGAVGYLLPTKIQIESKTIIDADQYDIHFLVENFTQWEKWSKWHEGDAPGVTLGVTTRGVGATQEWDNDYGQGKMLITQADPDKGIEYDYYFDSRDRVAKCSISYFEVENGVEVIWKMHGDIDVDFLGGYMRILFEQLHSKLISESLLKLKQIAEGIR